MTAPLITAIVSTYSAERFMNGCMKDLVAQTIFSECEVLVIDSGSPENESKICGEYARKHGQILVVRTEREPLYAAWNRAITMARGKYLTSANADDRHHPAFMEKLAQQLEARSDLGLVYCDQWISETENETWDQCVLRNARRRRFPDYSRAELLLRCITGSQPMWRRKLHDELGPFNTRYAIAADYDMWLRVAERHELLHLQDVWGVLFESPSTLSGTDNILRMNREFLEIQTLCMRDKALRELPGVRKNLAASWYGRGSQIIRRTGDNKAALPFIRSALTLDPFNATYLRSWFLHGLLGLTGR